MELRDLTNTILSKRRQISATQSMLVGISGIDASGKGYVTARLAKYIEGQGVSVANINVDGWLNLPSIRFSDVDPGWHFYKNALRLGDMFQRLALPLKHDRSVNITAEFAEETTTEFRPHQYNFSNIDIILVEGIFLFKLKYARHFDLKIWIECSFEAALQQAIARSQEGLSADQTIRAYETIYFPAQRLHFEINCPKVSAEIVLNNER